MSFELINNGEDSFITVFNPGATEPLQVRKDHANFKQIRDICMDQQDRGVDEEIDPDLFSVARQVEIAFKALSDRIVVRHGRVYYDEDEIHSSLTEHIVRGIEEETDDWMPWVKFLERVYLNPNEHSREQAYDWLAVKPFTITEDGMLVGYKGVDKDDKHGFVSCSSGHGFSDGVEYNGVLPNHIGAIVTMPRSEVNHDPHQGCSVGLHVGTQSFAKHYGDAMIEVLVDPRDIVSVPTYDSAEKVRVCRYTVHQEISKDFEYTTAVRYSAVVDDPAPEPEVEAGLFDQPEATPGPSKRNPTQQEWDDLRADAKRRKKGVMTWAHRAGWSLMLNSGPNNVNDRTNWWITE